MGVIITTEQPEPTIIKIERPGGEPETLYVQGEFSTEALIKAISKAAKAGNGNGDKTQRRKPKRAPAVSSPKKEEFIPETVEAPAPRRRGRPKKLWPEDAEKEPVISV